MRGMTPEPDDAELASLDAEIARLGGYALTGICNGRRQRDLEQKGGEIVRTSSCGQQTRYRVPVKTPDPRLDRADAPGIDRQLTLCLNCDGATGIPRLN